MAVPERDLQTFPPRQQDQQFPEGGYQPAPAQFPSQQPKPFPDYGGQPPGYHPITETSAMTTVVSAQPTAVASVQPPPEDDHTGMAVAALVLSIITLVCCGVTFFFSLFWTIPALILAIVAMVTRGTTQKCNAGISIGLSVTVVVITVVIGIVIALAAALLATTRHCPSYYSSEYSTYCQPYSNYVCTVCSCSYYYDSTSISASFCPT